MGKTEEIKLRGASAGTPYTFFIEPYGSFEATCQVCDGKKFWTSEHGHKAYCVKCKTIYSQSGLHGEKKSGGNPLIVPIVYDGEDIEHNVRCNECNNNQFMLAADHSAIVCGNPECMIIVAYRVIDGAVADMGGAMWHMSDATMSKYRRGGI